jgi:hypothetical protein
MTFLLFRGAVVYATCFMSAVRKKIAEASDESNAPSPSKAAKPGDSGKLAE